jgi:hypothetical protein
MHFKDNWSQQSDVVLIFIVWKPSNQINLPDVNKKKVGGVNTHVKNVVKG